MHEIRKLRTHTSFQARSPPRAVVHPPAGQTHTYDADGNLTADAVWLYPYNADAARGAWRWPNHRFACKARRAGARMTGGKTRQNRLRSSLPAAAGFTRLQIDFKYDYMGRRIQKSVFNLDTSALVERRYLYDGWNLLVEDLAKDQKSADWKVAIAVALKRRTTATNRWLGAALNMGGLHEVSRLVGARNRQSAPPGSSNPA